MSGLVRVLCRMPRLVVPDSLFAFAVSPNAVLSPGHDGAAARNCTDRRVTASFTATTSRFFVAKEAFPLVRRECASLLCCWIQSLQKSFHRRVVTATRSFRNYVVSLGL